MAKKLGDLTYLNEDVLYLRNKRIAEYDIVEGGYSISRNEGLLPTKFLRYLKTLDKKRRHIEIGKYAGEHKEFTKELFEGFRKYVTLFREENLIEDDKILSVKKDSITLYNSPIEQTKFGDYVEFTQREEATSYMLLEKKEFFLNSKTGKFWFKGFDSEIDTRDTLIEEIKKLMEFGEYKPKRFIFEYLRDLRQAYVTRELSHTYYRELNAVNSYKLQREMMGHHVYLDVVNDDMIDDLHIDHNYQHIIMPMMKIML